MPTYTWSRKREQLAAMVLRKLGAVGIGVTPASEDTAIVYDAMDARLKELHTLGNLWWNVAPAQTSITLTAGAATASIAASDFLYAVTANLVVGNEQKPLEIVSHLQYQAIPNKAQTGEPESVFISGSMAYLWPVPESTGTMRITYEAIAADTQTNTIADIPTAATRAFVLLIVADLVDEFGVPDPAAQRMLSQGKAAERTIRMVAQERVDTATVKIEAF